MAPQPLTATQGKVSVGTWCQNDRSLGPSASLRIAEVDFALLSCHGPFWGRSGTSTWAPSSLSQGDFLNFPIWPMTEKTGVAQ